MKLIPIPDDQLGMRQWRTRALRSMMSTAASSEIYASAVVEICHELPRFPHPIGAALASIRRARTALSLAEATVQSLSRPIRTRVSGPTRQVLAAV